MLVLVLLLLWFSCYTATTTHKGFCEQQQTAVLLVVDVYRWQRWHRGKICHSRGCSLWFGGGCLLWPPFVASAASVLCCLAVWYHILYALVCVSMYVLRVRILGQSCVLRSFHTAVRQRSSFFVSPPSPDALPCLIPHDGFAISFFE